MSLPSLLSLVCNQKSQIKNRKWAALSSVLILFAVGCSDRVPLEGTVTFDGQPLKHIGSITFMPEETGKRPAQGAIIGGKFIISTSSKEGVMLGKYKVVISCAPGGKEMLPPTYSSSQKTILTYEVPNGGNKDVHFDLNRAGTQ